MSAGPATVDQSEGTPRPRHPCGRGAPASSLCHWEALVGPLPRWGILPSTHALRSVSPSLTTNDSIPTHLGGPASSSTQGRYRAWQPVVGGCRQLTGVPSARQAPTDTEGEGSVGR
jgi:hypothetical protein